jgi:hypothetical protein
MIPRVSKDSYVQYLQVNFGLAMWLRGFGPLLSQMCVVPKIAIVQQHLRRRQENYTTPMHAIYDMYCHNTSTPSIPD